MAKIGLRYPVFAPEASHVDGAAITYSAGSVIGRAISANLTWTRNSNDLYSDDTIEDSDNSITDGEITFGLNQVPDEKRVILFGDEANQDGSQEINGEGAPFGGFGYIKVVRRAGVLSYVGHWIHRVQFGMNTDQTNTKGQNIEWQTPEIVGSITGVYLDDSGKVRWAKYKTFTDFADAKAWINGLAGITAASGSTTQH